MVGVEIVLAEDDDRFIDVDTIDDWDIEGTQFPYRTVFSAKSKQGCINLTPTEMNDMSNPFYYLKATDSRGKSLPLTLMRRKDCSNSQLKIKLQSTLLGELRMIPLFDLPLIIIAVLLYQYGSHCVDETGSQLAGRTGYGLSILAIIIVGCLLYTGFIDPLKCYYYLRRHEVISI